MRIIAPFLATIKVQVQERSEDSAPKSDSMGSASITAGMETGDSEAKLKILEHCVEPNFACGW